MPESITQKTRFKRLKFYSKSQFKKLWVKLSWKIPPIPGSPKFKSQTNRLIVRKITEQTINFKSLECIDTSTKKVLYKELKQQEKLVYSARTYPFEVFSFLLTTFFLFLLFFILLLGLPLSLGFLSGTNILAQIPEFFLEIQFLRIQMVFMVGILVALSPLYIGIFVLSIFEKFSSSIRIETRQLIFTFISFTLIILYIILIEDFAQNQFGNNLEPFKVFFSSILFNTTVLLILLIIIIFMSFGFSRIHTSWMVNNFPKAFIIDSLLILLIQIETSPISQAEMKFKNELMAYLEDISTLTSSNLSSFAKTGDKETDAWYANNTGEIAASFRSLKRQILIPNSSSQSQLVDKVSHALVCFLKDDLENLPHTEIQEVSHVSYLKQGWEIIRGLIAVAIAVIFFWLIQQSQFAIVEPFANYITLGLFLWAIVAIFTTLDPHFSQKMTTIKEVFSLPFFKP